MLLGYAKDSNNSNIIIFPDHGSREMGKGMEKKIKKIAGLKERGNK